MYSRKKIHIISFSYLNNIKKLMSEEKYEFILLQIQTPN